MASTCSSTRSEGPTCAICFVASRGTARYLVVGFAGGEVPTIGLNQTILKSISVVGVAYGVSAIVDPAGNRALFAQLFDWYREGKVRPHIGQRYPLAEGAAAIRTVGERRALGKVVIDM